jgi:pyruvate ferredoxin oxidoreductase delta subunit
MKDRLPAGLVKPASSKAYNSGTWRSMRPIWDKKRCTNCLLCVVYCPEDCIPAKKGKRNETNFYYCKGCGICANVCPVKCIMMRPEGEFNE